MELRVAIGILVQPLIIGVFDVNFIDMCRTKRLHVVDVQNQFFCSSNVILDNSVF